jgi:predicted DNA-binding transcriptional regulator YafY
MNRFDRALGILLLLRSGSSRSAADLARHFEVSPRTIYRDVETLSLVGVPVYAERGREGGFRLVEGYFLPPVMFTRTEAVSLLLAVTMLRSLRTRPFSAELETAEEKLLAAVPKSLRQVLSEARKVIGAESAPGDAFHPEPSGLEISRAPAASDTPPAAESDVVSVYLQAILDASAISLQYRSPYRATAGTHRVEPLGIFWDRDRWYLAGKLPGGTGELKLWRADRVLDLKPVMGATERGSDFDVRELLGRKWLQPAMEAWARESPVRIRISTQQKERLCTDWYYRYAAYEDLPNNRVLMTLGEDRAEVVFDLLRWLGPGAELIEPESWRAAFKAQLASMLSDHEEDVEERQ